MTKYEINATGKNGEDILRNIIAPNEKTAKRDFNQIVPGCKINSVMEIETGLPASKTQEREALEAIQAILETLGNDSYIGMALEGCLELAERNIEYDLGFSMKQSYENEKARARELEEALKRISQERDEAYSELANLRKAAFQQSDIAEFYALVSERKQRYEISLRSATERMVEFIEDAESPDFKKAICELKDAKRALEKIIPLFDKLTKIINEN